jgi:glycosyltransferase involved in cell wall biosynthesis
MEQTMITIVMGVFNEEKHLTSCIESILSQTFADFKLIISDNYSTDKTALIIDNYIKKDSRISKISPKYHCPSIEHGKFILEELVPKLDTKYCIFIGGHDIWDSNYLKILFMRAESSSDISVVYGEGFEIDYYSSKILTKYEDHVIVAEIFKPLVPHVMLLSLRMCLVMYGLIRRDNLCSIQVRHLCAGYDHFMATELALLGKVLHEPAAKLYLRQSKDHGSLEAYATRHLHRGTTNSAHQDFFKQIDWLLYLSNKAILLNESNSDFYSQAPIRNMLEISLLYGYIVRYLPNLNMLDPNGIQTFLNRPDMVNLYEANSSLVEFVKQLVVDGLIDQQENNLKLQQ